jgi:hypothetical protein
MRTAIRKYSCVMMPLLLPAFISMSIGCGSPGTHPSAGQTGTSSSAGPAATQVQTIYDGESLFRGIFFGTGEVAQKLPEIWQSQEQAKLAVLTPEQTAARLEAGGTQLRALGYPEQAERLALLASQVRNGALSPRDIARVADSKFSVGDRAAPEAAATYDNVVAYIKSLDSGFFHRFAAEIQSGNQLRVANAIREASKLLVESTNLGVDPTKLAKGEQSVGCPTCDPPCGGGGMGGIGGGGGGDGDFIAAPIATLVAVFAIAVVVVVAFWAQPPDETKDALQHDLWIDAITHRFEV